MNSPNPHRIVLHQLSSAKQSIAIARKDSTVPTSVSDALVQLQLAVEALADIVGVKVED